MYIFRELIGTFCILQAELVTHGTVVSRAAIALFLWLFLIVAMLKCLLMFL